MIPLQLLVLKLALQLLRLAHLAHGLVEIVLVDRLAVVLDGKQAPVKHSVSSIPSQNAWLAAGQNSRLSNNVSQIRAVEAVAHLDHALKVNVPVQHNTSSVDLENLQASNLVGQRNLNLAVQTART